jgi:cytochrome b6-f complex iron-sulfur subunit
VVILEPRVGRFLPGADTTGTGSGVNVLALSQRCPHLGCRPNPCLEDYWFHCPCHQSRYDRLGIKAAGEVFGPAPRGMDRYPVEVDDGGRLTIDTSRVIMGPLPIALGQPGLIPPLVAGGCR